MDSAGRYAEQLQEELINPQCAFREEDSCVRILQLRRSTALAVDALAGVYALSMPRMALHERKSSWAIFAQVCVMATAIQFHQAMLEWR